MKKSRKFVTLAVPLLCLGLTGCFVKKGSQVVIKKDTINVKLLLGGYGTEWMTKAIKQFEQIYAEEGYKVNLITPTKTVEGNAVYNDLVSGYAKKKVDVYFTGSLKPYRCVDEGRILVEDITDTVYNQKAIKFDGTEEELTVEEKLDPSFGDEWYQMNGRSYGFFYMKSIGSLVVNREKLFSFGYDHLPVTSNEFLEMVHHITLENLNGRTKVKPFVSTVNGTNGVTGYASVMMNSWFTQYSGADAWNTFWSMNNPDGSYNTETGYEVYLDEGLHKAAQLLWDAYDMNNFVKGSKNFSITDAHDSVMLPKSQTGGVFVFDGDWAYNETKANWTEEELQALSFINVPLISALGTKLWGDIITDEAECDRVLSRVASLADEGKEVSEIKTLVESEFPYTLSEESILRVCEARGVYNNRGVETGNCYLARGIGDHHKDIASKFLRMLASDDFSKMYFSTSKCFSPYSKVVDETVELSPFHVGVTQIASHKYASVIWPMTTGLRAKTGELEAMYPGTKQYLHSYALESQNTAYNDQANPRYLRDNSSELYQQWAEGTLSERYDYIRSQWSEWVRPFVG